MLQLPFELNMMITLDQLRQNTSTQPSTRVYSVTDWKGQLVRQGIVPARLIVLSAVMEPTSTDKVF
jgi:Mg/Co/Ni transporter MgtE